MPHAVHHRPSSSELRLRARREAAEFLRGLPVPADPAASLRTCAEAMSQASTPAEVHALTELAAGGEEAGLIALRNLLRAAGARCREHGEIQLATRYERTSDLLDIADRALFQLGVDVLTTQYDTTADTAAPCLTPVGHDEGAPT
ncbi:hypothetical protein GCM10010425_20560 [Streptomyces spororaveus]|uniref:Uncharacterized protein n=1 Tax=Streptomyces spororaveus TaxID=284039 RepID=A0ABQ3T792_9ACTN|nr:hypothetical protein [Streptomyces spororaveus]GHI76251.1 hypothetical protein Sspor_18120 [Streptomyces spororaveus]